LKRNKKPEIRVSRRRANNERVFYPLGNKEKKNMWVEKEDLFENTRRVSSSSLMRKLTVQM
jgi:hypothetical protein